MKFTEKQSNILSEVSTFQPKLERALVQSANFNHVIKSLKDEPPSSIVHAGEIASETDVQQWWVPHLEDLPTWSRECKNILFPQPSSAASDRVFLLLESSLTHIGKKRALEVLIPTAFIRKTLKTDTKILSSDFYKITAANKACAL